MTVWLPALLALAGAIVTTLGGYIIVKHQRSGKIDTTDAGVLWQEGKDLRDFLVSRIEAQESNIAELKFELRGCQDEVALLREELKKLWATK